MHPVYYVNTFKTQKHFECYKFVGNNDISDLFLEFYYVILCIVCCYVVE